MNEQNEEYEIIEEVPHNHFMMIPNLIDDMGLSPHAFRLYCHLKRVAGEEGKCWQGTAGLAKACGMSAGAISNAKKELMTTTPPLINIWLEGGHGGYHHVICIADIWKHNYEHYKKPSPDESVHQVNTQIESVHHMNAMRSPGETKKTPVKNTPLQEEKPLRGKSDLVDGILASEMPTMTIRTAIEKHFRLNVNWDTKASRQWLQWARNENVTSEQIRRAAERWRSDKLFNWAQPTLKGIFEKWRMLMDDNVSPISRRTAAADALEKYAQEIGAI